MTVRAGDGGCIELVNACPAADAEPLLQLLLATPGATIDWRACEGAHTAVVQVLMAARPRLLGPPADARLEEWLAPVIARPPEPVG
ncbi:MAG TPA: hypothetical protein VFX20_09570 [Steroidobacteraceae bacterium]|nr:hypothetical protein [Steroidobacteraceae bacterium]